MFQFLIDELDYGWYTGRALPRPLQDILTVGTGRHAALESASVMLLSAPRTIGGDGRAGAGDGGAGGGGGRGGVIMPREQ